METAFMKAIELILSLDAELLNILKVTAQMSIKSSVIALMIGLPFIAVALLTDILIGRNGAIPVCSMCQKIKLFVMMSTM